MRVYCLDLNAPAITTLIEGLEYVGRDAIELRQKLRSALHELARRVPPTRPETAAVDRITALKQRIQLACLHVASIEFDEAEWSNVCDAVQGYCTKGENDELLGDDTEEARLWTAVMAETYRD